MTIIKHKPMINEGDIVAAIVAYGRGNSKTIVSCMTRRKKKKEIDKRYLINN